MIGFSENFSLTMEANGLSDVLEALNGQSLTSVRVNPYKSVDLEFDLKPVPWCLQGGYLDDRPKFTLDPLFHGGAYYVQEASSMVVGQIAQRYAPQMVLDLCAAPGGKTTHLASVVGRNGCVVANEVIRNRASVLAENVQKWGSGNVIVTSSDAKNFGALNGIFDMIVADVPCSGEGMFRKDRDSRDQWSVENVALCAARGRRIVSDVWNALKEDGVFIYSTCTFNSDENQDNVRWICENLGAEVERFDVPTGVVESEWGCNFFPGRVGGEGFFVAVLRKRSSVEYVTPRLSKGLERVGKGDLAELRKWVDCDMDFRVGGDTIYGYGEGLGRVVELLLPFGLVYSGVGMGSLMRGELKPAHSLALFCGLQCDVFSDLDRDEALRFLARHNLDVNCYADGLGLVRYKGVGLGWAKGLGRRVNNLYPQNWRILNL